MGNGIKVKNWCIETISIAGWTLIVTRAYPEMLLCKEKVSITNINDNTIFSKENIKILNGYLFEVYGLEIPKTISDYEPDRKEKFGFNTEWVDRVNGRMKISFTLKKPGKWFSDIFR